MPNKKSSGRKRGENPLGLPANVYFKHGALYFVHSHSETTAQGTRRRVWLHLGRNVKEALRRAEVIKEARRGKS